VIPRQVTLRSCIMGYVPLTASYTVPLPFTFTDGPVAQARWLGSRVGSRLALFWCEAGVRCTCSEVHGHVTATYKLSYHYYDGNIDPGG